MFLQFKNKRMEGHDRAASLCVHPLFGIQPRHGTLADSTQESKLIVRKVVVVSPLPLLTFHIHVPICSSQLHMQSAVSTPVSKVGECVPDNNQEYDGTGQRQDNYLESGLGCPEACKSDWIYCSATEPERTGITRLEEEACSTEREDERGHERNQTKEPMTQTAGQITVHKVADKIQKLHGQINHSLARHVCHSNKQYLKEPRGTYCYCYYYDLFRGVYVVKGGSCLAGATLCSFLCG